MVSGVRQNADNQNLNFVQTLLFEYSRDDEIEKEYSKIINQI